MSASFLIQSAGFSVGLAVGGDLVTHIRGEFSIPNVSCLINKGVVRGRDFFAQFKDVPMDFDILGATEIEIKFDDLAKAVAKVDDYLGPTPVEITAGDYLVETTKRHRVRMAIMTDISFICFCTPTQL